MIAQTRKAASNVRALLLARPPCVDLRLGALCLFPLLSHPRVARVNGPGPYQVFSISSDLLVSEDMCQNRIVPQNNPVIAR